MSYSYFSKNGQLLPLDQAVVPLSDIAYSYGYGVYETIRVIGGIPYFLQQHVERLLASASSIYLEHHFAEDFISRAVAELVSKNDAQACNVKILLIGGQAADDAQLYMQCLNPKFPDRKLRSQGVSLVTENYERPFPQAKTLNMLPSYLAYRRATRAEAYDALLIDRSGNITEGTRTNFFVVKGRTLISPPEAKILLGVMRKVVIKVAQSRGYELEQRDIKLADLPDYEGAFLTSSSSKILAVRAIDKYQFGEQPPALKELVLLVDQFLENCQGLYDDANASGKMRT